MHLVDPVAGVTSATLVQVIAVPLTVIGVAASLVAVWLSAAWKTATTSDVAVMVCVTAVVATAVLMPAPCVTVRVRAMTGYVIVSAPVDGSKSTVNVSVSANVMLLP